MTVAWAETNNLRWAFTVTNAGSKYFENYSDLACLDKFNWEAVEAKDWRQCKERKQAEFLIEESFPLELITRMGGRQKTVLEQVNRALLGANQSLFLHVTPDWHY